MERNPGVYFSKLRIKSNGSLFFLTKLIFKINSLNCKVYCFQFAHSLKISWAERLKISSNVSVRILVILRASLLFRHEILFLIRHMSYEESERERESYVTVAWTDQWKIFVWKAELGNWWNPVSPNLPSISPKIYMLLRKSGIKSSRHITNVTILF